MSSPIPLRLIIRCGMLLLAGLGVKGYAERPQVHDGVLQTRETAPLPDSPVEGARQPRPVTSRSLALFARGHDLKRQRRFEEALAAFQHAWFWHPVHRRVLDEIVALAFSLDHNESAVKYAILAEEREPRDPELILQLADFLTQQGSFQRAADLYAAGQRLLQEEEPADDSRTSAFDRELAQACFLSDQFQRAVEPLQATIRDLDRQLEEANTPDQRDSLSRELVIFLDMLGECYRQDKQFAEARQAFTRARTLDGSHSARAYWDAQLAADQGDPAEARAELDHYLSLDEKRAGSSALELLTTLYADSPDLVLQKLAASLAQDPTDRTLGHFLAKQYLAAKRPADARDILEPMFHTRATIEVSQGLLACHRLENRPAMTLALLGRLAESDLDLSAVESEVDRILARPDFLDAIVQQARRRSVNDARPLLAREAFAVSLLTSAAKKWETADEFLQLALERADPTQQDAWRVAWAFDCLAKERYSSAATMFRETIQRSDDPGDKAENWFYLATALGLNEQTDEALQAIDAAIALVPNSNDFHNRKAWLLAASDRQLEARDLYLQRLSLASDPSRASTLLTTRVALASLAAELGDASLAEEQLVAVLAYDPENVGAMNDLGYLWADHDLHLERAEALISAAVAAEPDNPAYRDSLGWLHYRQGNLDAAVTHLQQAVDGSPTADGTILSHLADAYHALGKPAQAQLYWQQAIDAFREAGQLEKIDKIEEQISSPGRPTTAETE